MAKKIHFENLDIHNFKNMSGKFLFGFWEVVVFEVAKICLQLCMDIMSC